MQLSSSSKSLRILFAARKDLGTKPLVRAAIVDSGWLLRCGHTEVNSPNGNISAIKPQLKRALRFVAATARSTGLSVNYERDGEVMLSSPSTPRTVPPGQRPTG